MKKKSSPYRSMFLAVELEEDLKKLLAERLYLLEDKKLLRIESRRNFHITIGFIAHVHEKHRRDVINCFKPLKEFTAFLAHVEGPVILGQYQQILCAKFGPIGPFQVLHEKAKIFLVQNTDYNFDEKHEEYIPHTKIESIRKVADEEKKTNAHRKIHGL